MDAFQEIGHTSTAYLCHSTGTLHFNTEQDGYIYRADWRITDIHVQAFNVKNNVYSQGWCETHFSVVTHSMHSLVSAQIIDVSKPHPYCHS